VSRTLKAIRQDAPRSDRNGPALAPRPAPQWVMGRDGSPYVHIYLFPRTLDELRSMSREFGDGAVAYVQWGAVTTWLMNQPHELDLRNPRQVALASVMIVRDYDRQRFGWPRHDGKEWNRPQIEFLSPDVRKEAELVAAETMEDWKKAGMPHLGRNAIRRAYLFLTTTPAFRTKCVPPMAEDATKETQ